MAFGTTKPTMVRNRRIFSRVSMRASLADEMAGRSEFDVVVVGASLGGCTAARLFALAGARVALVERRPDPAAYKVTCTHEILSSAVPTIERLGLAPLLEERGAVRSHIEVWSPYGGGVPPPA